MRYLKKFAVRGKSVFRRRSKSEYVAVNPPRTSEMIGQEPDPIESKLVAAVSRHEVWKDRGASILRLAFQPSSDPYLNRIVHADDSGTRDPAVPPSPTEHDL